MNRDALLALADRIDAYSDDANTSGLSDIAYELRTLAAQPDVQSECEWVFDDCSFAPMWNSACGESWSFTEGGPPENSYKFCHGCGKSVAIKEPT